MDLNFENRKVMLTETILRDAHQSQAATRMKIEEMLPVLEQLDEMKNKKISDTELESARKSLKNAYMNIYDSPAGMELWTLNRGLSGNFDIPNGEAKKLDSVTKEQISEFANGITLDTVYFLKGEDDNG